jgi:hypothetical protein
LTGDATGGAPILSYYLQWDNATNGVEWYDVVGFTDIYLLLEFYVTSNVFAGLSYQFRIKAKNSHGWQTTWSPLTTLIASQKPN